MVLCGADEHTIPVVRNVILIAKQYLYRQKCLNKSISVHELRRLVHSTKNMDKYYAIKNNLIPKFVKKWAIYDKYDAAHKQEFLTEYMEAIGNI